MCKDSFLRSYNNAEKIKEELKPHHTYDGTSTGSSVIARLKLVENQLVRTKECFCDSIFLKKETVCAFLDMEFKQMIVTCEPSTILLFINWKCIRVYTDTSHELNTYLHTC